LIRLDSDWPTIAKQAADNPSASAKPQDLAYVLFTSGSTGKPKGVEIPHRALVNFLVSMQREPGFTAADTLLAVTTLSFDIAGLELYLPLISGGKLLLASREDALDPVCLMSLLRDGHCTVMQATPATWRALLDAGWAGSPNLKILCGGEAFPKTWLASFCRAAPSCGTCTARRKQRFGHLSIRLILSMARFPSAGRSPTRSSTCSMPIVISFRPARWRNSTLVAMVSRAAICTAPI
jgi:non-ribosomal peptide synthetase component F